MQQSNGAARSWLLVPLGGALVVIGAKFWLIANYGNPTPFWDQWDAEGAILYPKYFGGTLTLGDLLSAHNEHRILLTRLWSLLLLALEGYWDPILQMAANTLLFGAFAALFIAAFRPLFARADWLAFAAFATIMFALPFGWENTLEGFNSQWYFLLLASLAGLLAITAATAFSPRWWLGFLLLVVSYFCTAAGALSMGAAFAICLAQFSTGSRREMPELLALALLALGATAMLRDIPMIPGMAPLKAHSISEFLRAAVQTASWPATPGPVPLLLQFPCAILINVPAVAASLRVVRVTPPLADRQWLLPALAVWSLLQMIAIAYGRAAGTMAPRYFDLYLIATLANGASLIYLLHAWRHSWLNGRRGLAAVALWLLLIVAGSAAISVRQLTHSIPLFAKAGRAETANMRAFLATSDRHALENKARLEIPHPDPQRLVDVTSIPAIRAILPPVLVGEENARRAHRRGLARYTGRAVEALKAGALRWGFWLVPLGLALFAAGAMRARAGPLSAAGGRTL